MAPPATSNTTIRCNACSLHHCKKSFYSEAFPAISFSYHPYKLSTMHPKYWHCALSGALGQGIACQINPNNMTQDKHSPTITTIRLMSNRSHLFHSSTSAQVTHHVPEKMVGDAHPTRLGKGYAGHNYQED